MAPGEAARAASFERIVSAYDARNWTAALDEARRHRSEFPEADRVVALYEERVTHFVENPPPAEWDGVYSVTSK